MIEATQARSGHPSLTHNKGSAAAQFLSWPTSTYQDHVLLSVGIRKASSIYQSLCTNPCLLQSSCGATPTIIAITGEF